MSELNKSNLRVYQEGEGTLRRLKEKTQSVLSNSLKSEDILLWSKYVSKCVSKAQYFFKKHFQITPSSCYAAPASVSRSVNLTALGTSPRPRSNHPSVCPLWCTAKDVCVIRIFEGVQKSYHYSEIEKDLDKQLVNGTFNWSFNFSILMLMVCTYCISCT